MSHIPGHDPHQGAPMRALEHEIDDATKLFVVVRVKIRDGEFGVAAAGIVELIRHLARAYKLAAMRDRRERKA